MSNIRELMATRERAFATLPEKLQRMAILDKEEAERIKISIPKTYHEGNLTGHVFSKVDEYTAQRLIESFRHEIDMFMHNWDDPESRVALANLLVMLDGPLRMTWYQWGAHKIFVELHRIDVDRFMRIQKEYQDYFYS